MAVRAQGITGAHPPLTAVLFDSDGVLVNSVQVVERHWRRWASKHHVDVDRVLAIVHGRRTIDVIRQLAPNLDAESCAAAFDDVEGRDDNGLFAYHAAHSLLEQLSRGSWGVVTSGGRELALRRLGLVGLPTPPTLVTGDDIGRGKPYPDCYLLGAKRLGLPPQACVAIEDAPAGVEAAAIAGMTTVAVTSTHQARELARADFIVSSLAEAAEWLRAHLLASCWKSQGQLCSVPLSGH